MTRNKQADLAMTPAALAALMTDEPGKHDLALGRKWTVSDGAKRVRSIARDRIDRFVNRTGRTMHVYTLAEARVIVDEARRATGGGIGQDVSALRDALTSDKPAARKRTRKPASKPAASPQDGPQDGTAAE
jgi:hypothetical protein